MIERRLTVTADFNDDWVTTHFVTSGLRPSEIPEVLETLISNLQLELWELKKCEIHNEPS